MTALATEVRRRSIAGYRWLVMAGLAVSVGIYFGLHSLDLSEQTGLSVNDLSWWIAAFIAALLCWRTARKVPIAERTSWYLLGSACLLWFAGQTVWNYYEVLQGRLPAFPHWMQALFAAYDWTFVAGLLWFPRPSASKQITPRHLGNLLLIVCALSVALLILLFEPAMMPTRNLASNYVVASHCIGLATMFVTALYLLWSHRWEELHWPIVLLLTGAGLHTGTYITYIHDLMIGRYVAGSWINVSWLFVFGAYAAAAYERSWQIARLPVLRHESLGRRERVLEALVPALLIAMMLAVAWLYREWLTDRAATLALAPAVGFAVVLGLREAWIQRQEQGLLKSLSDVNTSMQQANAELQQSETRFRKLNAELEGRVAERTMELEEAYRELENFSYAVAHDLKAPLRAVDGFGSMLAHEYGDRLDNTGQHYLQRMRTSALKMSELIDDLLAYARVDRREFNLRKIPLQEMIRQVLQEQQDEIQQRKIEVTVDLPNVDVMADAAGLLMALRNLVQNAIKFSRQAQPPRVVINARDDGPNVLVSVRDNGIGFDMAYHERIFEMFQRLHRADEIPGTGIGLAIVRKAIERMGGAVWAESKPGDGATFFLRLAKPTIA